MIYFLAKQRIEKKRGETHYFRDTICRERNTLRTITAVLLASHSPADGAGHWYHRLLFMCALTLRNDGRIIISS